MTLNDHFQSFHISYKNMRELLKQRMQSEAIPKKNLLQMIPKKKRAEVQKKMSEPRNGDSCEINLVTN